MGTTNVHEADSRGRTALHHAAYAGDKDLLVKLLRMGADVEAVTVAGSNALHMAAKAGHAGLLSRLINPTTLDCQNSQGFTPLQVALLYKQWEVAAKLVAAGAAPYGPSSVPSLECPSDDTPAPALLLKDMLADSSPTGLVAQALRWRGYKGRTMLHTAARHGIAQWVEHLLAAGPDKDAVDAAGFTPLHLAADYGYAQLVPLLAMPKNINQHVPPSQRTPLHMAAGRGHLPVVEALLRAGAEVDAKDGSSCSALAIAAGRGGRPMVAVLLAAGATPNTQDSKGRSPLLAAVERGDDHMVKVLLAAGAAADTQDTSGSSALAVAAKAGNMQMCRLLLHSLVKLYGVTQLQEPDRRQQQQQQQEEEEEKERRKQDHGRWRLKDAAVTAVVPLAGDIPCCSQLLGVVLDVLEPELTERVCHDVQWKLRREGDYNLRMEGPINHLAEALLLGWLGAEAGRLVPARLQRLVPGVGSNNSQQQQQQQLAGQAAGHGQELWDKQKQLVSGAVLAAVQGQQQQAHALLAECAELHLQQSGAGFTCISSSALSRPSGTASGSKHGVPQQQPPQHNIPDLVQLVCSGLFTARDVRTANGVSVINGPPARPGWEEQYSKPLQRALLSSWVAARKESCTGLVAPVLAAVTTAQRGKEAAAEPHQQ